MTVLLITFQFLAFTVGLALSLASFALSWLKPKAQQVQERMLRSLAVCLAMTWCCVAALFFAGIWPLWLLCALVFGVASLLLLFAGLVPWSKSSKMRPPIQPERGGWRPWFRRVVMLVFLALWVSSWRESFSAGAPVNFGGEPQAGAILGAGLVVAIGLFLFALRVAKRSRGVLLEAGPDVDLGEGVDRLLNGLPGSFLIVIFDEEQNEFLQFRKVAEESSDEEPSATLEIPLNSLAEGQRETIEDVASSVGVAHWHDDSEGEYPVLFSRGTGIQQRAVVLECARTLANKQNHQRLKLFFRGQTRHDEHGEAWVLVNPSRAANSTSSALP